MLSLAAPQEPPLPAQPPGPYCSLTPGDHAGAASFTRGQPVVGTSYFYWYDLETNAHIVDGDGTDALTDHAADMDNLSYKHASWHRTQLMDMMDAGIDFLMPVFWGVPGKYDGWSFAGLPQLVAAHDALLAEGRTPPPIGLFYDSTDLESSVRHGAFRHAGSMAVTGSSEWKTASFDLPECWFANRANGADFRFAVRGGDLRFVVREVVLRRK